MKKRFNFKELEYLVEKITTDNINIDSLSTVAIDPDPIMTSHKQDYDNLSDAWAGKEHKVINHILNEKNFRDIIGRLHGSFKTSSFFFDLNIKINLGGQVITYKDVFSPGGKLRSRPYTNKLIAATKIAYKKLLGKVTTYTPHSGASYLEILKKMRQLQTTMIFSVDNYMRKVVNIIQQDLPPKAKAEEKGFFGKISSYFFGSEPEPDASYNMQDINAIRNKVIALYAASIASFLLVRRLGSIKITGDEDSEDEHRYEKVSGHTKDYTRALTFFELLKKELAPKEYSYAKKVAQASKDKFRRDMKSRQSQGKESFDQWFAVHYPYAYSRGNKGGYFVGVAEFVKGRLPLSSTGEAARSADEIATIAYPKEHKKLNDNIAIGKAGFGKFPKIAVILDGKITAVYRHDIYSDTFGSASVDRGHGGFRGSSGFVRYAGGQLSKHREHHKNREHLMIHDVEKYKEEILKKGKFPGRTGYNEAFLDNWKSIGIACNWQEMMVMARNITLDKRQSSKKAQVIEAAKSLKELHSLVLSRNLKVYDENFNPISNQVLGNIFNQIIQQIANANKVKISYNKFNINKLNKDIKPEAGKEIYFKVEHTNEAGVKTTLFRSTRKKINVNRAISLFQGFLNYGGGIRPKFYYGTEKSNNGSINWQKFTPRIIKKKIIQEFYSRLLRMNKRILLSESRKRSRMWQ